ncbi:MAG: CDP-archaeol synthase [Gammaproteobacteria bacterium]
MLCFKCIAVTVILLITANGAPVLARKLFGQRYGRAVDNGWLLPDRQPLFGHAKTWRGVASAIAATAATAPLFGIAASVGALFGALSMSGDLLASFCKRRLGYAVSGRSRLLDAFPEALLPAIILSTPLGLGLSDTFTAAATFFLLEVSCSPILYRLHIRNRPY